MQSSSFVLCFIYVTVASACGGDRRLRGGPTDSGLWSSFAEKSGWVPGPGPIGKKPTALKDLEAFHDDWILPVSSLKNFALTNWFQLIVTSAIWVTLVVLAAFMYKRSAGYLPETGPKPLDAVKTQNDLSEWQSEWYQCHRYPEIFLWACCCPCVRWAHTMDLLQFLDYWPAFFIFLLLVVMNQLTGFFFIGIFFTMMLVLYRQKMRKLFGMGNTGTCIGYTTDCLGLFCCWPCFIAQEANHVAQAAKLGWTKDLAIKSGFFSARYETSASQES